MTATITAPTAPIAAPVDRTTTTTSATPTATTHRAERLATGVGALGFATVVLGVNAIVGSTPAWDAPAQEISAFVADERGKLVASVAAYGLAMPFLLAFVAGIAGRFRRLARTEDQVWGRMGVGAALLILPFFGSVVAQRIVLLVGADERIGSPDLVALAWRMEGAAFVLNVAVVGLAAFGVAFTAARAGLLPRWFRGIGVLAGVTGIAGAATGLATLEGGPTMGLGLVSFLAWQLTLVTIGVGTLRASD